MTTVMTGTALPWCFSDVGRVGARHHFTPCGMADSQVVSCRAPQEPFCRSFPHPRLLPDSTPSVQDGYDTEQFIRVTSTFARIPGYVGPVLPAPLSSPTRLLAVTT